MGNLQGKKDNTKFDDKLFEVDGKDESTNGTRNTRRL
jgi:hypothetical protein